MKYKNVLIIICLFFSCNDDYLTRTPETNITETSFWTSTNDIETYANQFYTTLPDFGGYDSGLYGIDGNSDNMIFENYDKRLAGLNVVPNNGGFSYYDEIRKVNYFLEKGMKVKVSAGELSYKESLIGEGYFFRAWYYFELLKRYGGVPWIDKVLTPDSEDLYNKRESRNIIADKIISDLYTAEQLLKSASEAQPMRINKEIALSLLSRVALFEGTWEKYHAGTVFAAPDSNPEKYLEIAMKASESIITGKYGTTYQIFSTGNASEDYSLLFNQDDLSNNSEIIFWKKHDFLLKTGHNLQRYAGITYPHPTKSLIDSYLCSNGRPIHNSDGLYEGDNLPLDIFKNRDLRLRQITLVKGDARRIENGDTLIKFDKGTLHLTGQLRTPTGFNFKKGLNPINDNGRQLVDFTSNTAYIYFRYAEILLNFVEAKAELDQVTQSDIDLTINIIRDRVHMEHFDISNIPVDPNWQFPNQSPIINEIRRERRNELACEGFRFYDLMRWRGHHLISSKKPLGVKFNPELYPELQIGDDLYLNDEGYVEPYAKSLPNGWGFNPERDYLLPVPKEQLTLNNNLVQNPGW